MPGIKVIAPGMYTTVQDLGRRGLQQYGVPVSGAMDEFSLRSANSLVNNCPTSAALEATLIGPTLSFTQATFAAVTGARAPVAINGTPVPMWQALYVRPGDVLSIGTVTLGARVYIAVAGGIDVPAVMGSRSTFIRGNIGGVEGRTLKQDDVLPIGESPGPLEIIQGNFVPLSHLPELPQGVTTIRVVMGPQDDCFHEDALYIFSRAVYTISNESDRMGYRLEGAALAHREKPDIVSDGIAPGSIQVPGHGKPIVMLADRQTTGGYAKIATVISADLWLMGQLKPQDELRFVAVSLAEANAALREQQQLLKSLPHKSLGQRRFSIRLGNQVFTTIVSEVVEEG